MKGHISLCTAVFPEKTPGSKVLLLFNSFIIFLGPAIDAFARMPLWKAGLNYRHGTGHGVGAFLNVHEGEYEDEGIN